MVVNGKKHSFFYEAFIIISCFYLLFGQSHANSNPKTKSDTGTPSQDAGITDKWISTSGLQRLLKTLNSKASATDLSKLQTWKNQMRTRKNYAKPSISRSHSRTAQNPYVAGRSSLPNYGEAANTLGHRTPRDAAVLRRLKRDYDDDDAEGNDYDDYYENGDANYDLTGRGGLSVNQERYLAMLAEAARIKAENEAAYDASKPYTPEWHKRVEEQKRAGR